MIDLHTAATANGYKVSIMLEEIGYAYRVDGPPSASTRFAPAALLLDPAAPLVDGRRRFGVRDDAERARNAEALFEYVQQHGIDLAIEFARSTFGIEKTSRAALSRFNVAMKAQKAEDGKVASSNPWALLGN